MVGSTRCFYCKTKFYVFKHLQCIYIITRGWPLSFEDCSFQGSPILYDIDGDGKIKQYLPHAS